MKHTLIIFFILLTGLVNAQKAFEVTISGKGQALIFLPGFTTPGSVWDQTIAALDKNYTVYQFTYAGFGGVAPIELPWYSTLSDQLAAYMESENIKKAIIVGHSMGGMLAIDLAAKVPGRIEKMVLVDALPCIRAVMMPQYTADQIQLESPYTRQMIAMTDSAMRQTATYMAQGMTNSADKYPTLINWILKSDRETYVYGYTELLKLDLRPKLANIETNTLVLAADFPTKEVASQTINAQFQDLKNKEIKIAPGSKHFIMFDQPQWFYDELNAFLNPDNPGRRGAR